MQNYVNGAAGRATRMSPLITCDGARKILQGDAVLQAKRNRDRAVTSGHVRSTAVLVRAQEDLADAVVRITPNAACVTEAINL
jgi:hypothetical protein